MKKKEIILLFLLERFLENKSDRVTQLEISKFLGVSISTVSNALSPLAEIGAVECKRNGVFLSDFKKALLYFATIRALQRDIVFETFVPQGVAFAEKNLPSGIFFTMFSGYRFQFDDVPADYSEVYAYADEDALTEIKKRFPKAKGPANLIVLKSDALLSKLFSKNIVPKVLLFADLWNARQWQAKEFLTALEEKLGA